MCVHKIVFPLKHKELRKFLEVFTVVTDSVLSRSDSARQGKILPTFWRNVLPPRSSVRSSIMSQENGILDKNKL